MKIGEIMPLDREITLNEGRKTVCIDVANTGDRPIQVGSHFHFFEVNKLLSFNREKAYGMRLDIPSGTSVRFEPGEQKSVQLVEIVGNRAVYGLNDLTSGNIDEKRDTAISMAKEKGFKGLFLRIFQETYIKILELDITFDYFYDFTNSVLST